MSPLKSRFVEFRVKGFLVLEHPVDDAKCFVHAHTYGSHLAHSIGQRSRVCLFDHGVILDG